MKHVLRAAPPSCMDNDVPQVRLNKERLYAAQDPWKGLAASEKQYVYDALLKMFDGECAFCGKRLYLHNTDTQADHFLPQKSFKFLSLCWENLILLCGDCNNRKRSFSPKSLGGKIFIENFMKNSAVVSQDAEVFDKNQVFCSCEDRLIDPSLDEPSEHISFDPASRQFMHLTPMGRLMIERFFNRVRWFDELLEKLSDEVKYVVEKESQPERVIARYIKLNGHSFFRWEFYKYWAEMKKKRCISEE